MAAIGAGWVDGAWIEAGWVTEAWAQSSDPPAVSGSSAMSVGVSIGIYGFSFLIGRILMEWL